MAKPGILWEALCMKTKSERSNVTPTWSVLKLLWQENNKHSRTLRLSPTSAFVLTRHLYSGKRIRSRSFLTVFNRTKLTLCNFPSRLCLGTHLCLLLECRSRTLTKRNTVVSKKYFERNASPEGTSARHCFSLSVSYTAGQGLVKPAGTATAAFLLVALQIKPRLIQYSFQPRARLMYSVLIRYSLFTSLAPPERSTEKRTWTCAFVASHQAHCASIVQWLPGICAVFCVSEIMPLCAKQHLVPCVQSCFVSSFFQSYSVLIGATKEHPLEMWDQRCIMKVKGFFFQLYVVTKEMFSF